MPFRFFPVMPGSRHALGVRIAAAALVGALALADAGGHCLADQLVVVHVDVYKRQLQHRALPDVR